MSETDVGIVGGAFWRASSCARGCRLATRQTAAEALAIALVAAMLLSVAFWNGFPIIFYDTGAYILQGLANYFVPERSPVYSLFPANFRRRKRACGRSPSRKRAIAAFVDVEFCARAGATALALDQLLGIGCVSQRCAPVSAGYVGEIEPDCFAAVTRSDALAAGVSFGRTRAVRSRASGRGCARLATAAHPSHLGLAAEPVPRAGVLRCRHACDCAIG